MNFASDNCSGAHPLVMDAIVRANTGYMPSYGEDPIMDIVRQQVRDLFEAPNAAVYLVATGSTSNSLALATVVKPWSAIYSHRHAHIQSDECGAPEFFTGGARLVGIDGAGGKISAMELEDAISSTPKGDVHSYQRGAISITNTTEAGTVYSCDEVAAIGAVAQQYKLPLHMDGARFANALVSEGCSAAEMTWKSGVDVLSFGGTKNGLMGVEAVVLFDPELAWEFELRRKRAGHLLSKHRFLSAQMQAYLTDDLWLDLANTANNRAAQLSSGLLGIEGANLSHPVQANMVFMEVSRAKHRRAIAAGAAYSLAPFSSSLEGDDAEILSSRLVCSWSTTEAAVDQFLGLIKT